MKTTIEKTSLEPNAQTGLVRSGIFAKKSHPLHNQMLLTDFIYACKNKQHDLQSNILIECCTNLSLIPHEATKEIIPSWCNELDQYRKAMHTSLLNCVLATALLKILNKDYSPCLTREFITLLGMLALESEQLANSILAIVMHAENDIEIYELCQTSHSVKPVLHQKSWYLTLNTASLFIAPFPSIYSKSHCFAKLMKHASAIDNLHRNNFIECIHAILKKISGNDTFWHDPDITVRELMMYLNQPDFIDFGAPILVDIQRRLPDKNFLKTFYTRISTTFGKENSYARGIFEAIHMLMNSEEEIVKHLQTYYEKLPTKLVPNDLAKNRIFIQRMTKYINMLQCEEHIMEGLTHLLKLFSKTSDYYQPAIASVVLLLPKIRAQDFLVAYIATLFTYRSISDIDIKFINDLSSICLLTRLSDDSINTLLDHFYTLHKTDSCSVFQYKMTVNLYSRVESKLAIHKWLGMISSVIDIKKIDQHPLEWFKNNKNFMYFECYLILLLKTQEKHSVKLLMNLLLRLADDSNLSAKVIGLAAKLLPDINSKFLVRPWIPVLYNMCLGFNMYYSTNLCLLTQDNKIIKDEIGRFTDILEQSPSVIMHEFYGNIIPLLLNSPVELSQKITDTVLHVIDKKDIKLLPSIDEYIKKYSQADQELKVFANCSNP